MPTGQTIINNALTILGILEQSGTPSASDSAAALTELNAMSSAWDIDEGLIYSVRSFSNALTTATASYTIGTGATFNTPLPTRLYKAIFSVGGNNRNDLTIVDALRYYSHNDLTASTSSGGAPDEVYLDFNVDPTTGFGKVYLFPVPVFTSPTPQIELELGQNFNTWALGTNVILPYGYQDAIQYALAFRLIPQYGGIVAPQVMQTVMEIGQKAELRLRTMNAINRQIPPQAAALQPLEAPPVAPGGTRA